MGQRSLQRLLEFQEKVKERVRILETALDELRKRSPEAEDSVRRLARSISHSATEYGLPEIRGVADRLAAAETRRQIFSRARVLLDRVGRDPAAPVTGVERVLLVEDDPISAQILKSVLSAENRRVMVAETAAEARELLGEQVFDLMVLDLVLPDADGRDFLLELREQHATAETPVVFSSSRPAEQAKAECLALGAQDYLEKPVEPELARSVVSRLLEEPTADGLGTPAGGAQGLANRAALSEALRTARAHDPDSRNPVSLACIEIDAPSGAADCEPGAPWGQASLEVQGRIQAALRPSDLLAVGTAGKYLALFPKTPPDVAAGILQAAQAGAKPEEPSIPAEAGTLETTFSGGVAEVPPEATLGEAIARAERRLSLARSAETSATIHWRDEPIPSRPRILLVEDDRVTARLILHRLGRDGFDVVHFDDGLAAFEALEDEQFEMAILDVKLPGMDGFELLQSLRGLPKLRETPIIMLTSMGREDDIVRGFELGASDYVSKPFSPTELVARIHRLLRT